MEMDDRQRYPFVFPFDVVRDGELIGDHLNPFTVVQPRHSLVALSLDRWGCVWAMDVTDSDDRDYVQSTWAKIARPYSRPLGVFSVNDDDMEKWMRTSTPSFHKVSLGHAHRGPWESRQLALLILGLLQSSSVGLSLAGRRSGR